VAVAADPALALNLIQRVCVGDILTRGAQHFGEKLALVDGDHELSYRELDRRANAVGRALLELGLERQEPVGILSRNSWELVVAYFGCAKAGLVAQPVNLGLKPDEIGWVLEQTSARVLLVDGALADLAALLPQVEHTFIGLSELLTADPSPLEVLVEDRDAVQCLYTSGTTSLPKGVVTSHLTVTMAALAAAVQLKSDGRDTALIPLPLFHTAALNAILIPILLAGGTAVLLPAYDVRAVLDALEARRVTYALLLPMMWQDLLAQPDVRERDLSALRLCLYGMAQMSPERVAELRTVFGAEVLLGSGQTEFLPPTTFQHAEHQAEKSGSWGRPTSLTDVRIVDEDGNLLPRGEVGEIVYRGPQCMTEYFGSPEATAEAFRDAWFHSGDVGYLDEEGVVWFTDRKKDMVKSGGENVSSIEVERALLSHPAVTDCAVVGIPHERWGEAVTAFVAGSAAEEELLAWCQERLAAFKVPKRIVVVDAFPRTGTGKIQKQPLREAHRGLYGSQ
jgi:acyl-CoA synthetase (AMP-forming)/AMP-acid ligase II